MAQAGAPTEGRLPEAAATMWGELVQKQKVHEIIKGLHAEKKKLQILHNVVPDSDFTDFATEEVLKRQAETATEETEEDDVKRVRSSKSKPISGDAKSTRRSSGGMSKSASRYRLSKDARNTAEVLSKKKTLTEKEFEAILDLCEDRIEQKALREAYIEKKARERYLENAGEGRIWLYDCLNCKFFINFMLFTITVSIAGMFALTFDEIAIRYSWGLVNLDSGIIGIFLVEAIMKIIIYKEDYFKQVWNLLDILVIIVHLVEIFWGLLTRMGIGSNVASNYIYTKYIEIWFNLLQSLRVLRLLRVIKFLPSLKVIVATVFKSMVSIGSIALLMLLFMCVFTVIGRGLFDEVRPSKFGNVALSFVTLFKLLTLDDWFDVLQGTHDDANLDMDNTRESATYVILVLYLFLYLVIEYFIFLNLFVAVLVDNFQLSMADVEIQKQKEAQKEAENLLKFEEMKQDMMDTTMTRIEHEKHVTEMQKTGLLPEDYFEIDKDSPEVEHLSEFFKNANSLDYERFMWSRRFTILNRVTDTAINHRNLFAGDVDEMREEETNKDGVHDEGAQVDE